MKVKVAQSCPTLRPQGLQHCPGARPPCPRNPSCVWEVRGGTVGKNPTDHNICCRVPGKNTGVGCHFLLQGIFPTQGLNRLLPPPRTGLLFCLETAADRQLRTATSRSEIPPPLRTRKPVTHTAYSPTGTITVNQSRVGTGESGLVLSEKGNSACLSRCLRGDRPVVELYVDPVGFSAASDCCGCF